jgi:hypothetical protein
VNAASSHKPATPMATHRSTDRRDTVRDRGLGLGPSSSVTFQNKGRTNAPSQLRQAAPADLLARLPRYFG